ncbi:NifU family protein [Paeniglutamicibacter antarcticus]|uniref:NifU family protein n=1 Tax=Arthrobacter terrae TaxID=2935737 RepID=A0A931CPB4_9MICC|nr:NifU family protein [Arthrobacter terrae]MBG0740552.1 NifU family protein [Arthrobacter terrae]
MNAQNGLLEESGAAAPVAAAPVAAAPWAAAQQAAAAGSGADQLRNSGTRIGTLLDALSSNGAVARERAEELVRQVTDLYGAGLERMLGVISARGGGTNGTLEALVKDELISGLLLVHGLHPQDVPTRVAAALDSVRPYLGSHGGDVELLGISANGIVSLRLLGSCHGCPSSSVTLKLAVEDAIETAAPEVTSIQVVEQEPIHSAAVIPVNALRLRLDQQTDRDQQAKPAVPGPAGGSWEPAAELGGLQPGEVAGFLVGGARLLTCRIGEDIFAYLDYCPRCAKSMAGASLQRALAAPTGGGLLRCPTCRAHFDVRLAGACLEDKSLHLDPLPLLVRGGVISVAIPVGTVS